MMYGAVGFGGGCGCVGMILVIFVLLVIISRGVL
jgi:hypothetical protein